MVGGERLGAFVLPELLGGVLKGDRSSVLSVKASGASDSRPAISAECDLLGIFGFPARLTGGGTGGAEAVGLSPFRRSAGGPTPGPGGNSGFESWLGVTVRAAILNGFVPAEAVVEAVEDASAACEDGREGRGERMGVSWELVGGDLGDCTVTLGGDRAWDREGDRGGEKATMDVGRGLELLHGMRERGVTVPLPL